MKNSLLRTLFVLFAVVLCLFTGCRTAGSGAAETQVSEGDGLLHIRFFEVKNSDASTWGDCTLVQFPDGESMLVDFGGRGAGAEIAGYLKEAGITHITYAVFSHCHGDHAPGIQDMIEAGIRFDHAMTSGYIPTNYSWMAGLFKAYGMDTTVLNAGSEFDVGDVHFLVLAPFPEDLDHEHLGRTNAADSGPGSNRDMNNSSIVMKMTYGDFSMLFTGDIYTDQEQHILEKYSASPEVLDIDVLKLMHHGKDSSGSSEWIRATSPKLAVAEGLFSVSASKCMEYLDAGAQDIYFTWMNGNVYVTSDGKGFTYSADRPEMIGSHKGIKALYEYKKAQQAEQENK